jgi:hypothetical protein
VITNDKVYGASFSVLFYITASISDHVASQDDANETKEVDSASKLGNVPVLVFRTKKSSFTIQLPGGDLRKEICISTSTKRNMIRNMIAA